MPLYEYRCSKCAKVFEVLQKFSDPELKKHPGCGGKVERLISASGFQLKGTGWYATDYAKAGSAKDKDAKAEAKGGETTSDGAKTESKSDSKAESSSESKSESKTESKSESKSESKKDSKSESRPAKASKKD